MTSRTQSGVLPSGAGSADSRCGASGWIEGAVHSLFFKSVARGAKPLHIMLHDVADQCFRTTSRFRGHPVPQEVLLLCVHVGATSRGPRKALGAETRTSNIAWAGGLEVGCGEPARRMNRAIATGWK
jgi:hypothetical protein